MKRIKQFFRHHRLSREWRRKRTAHGQPILEKTREKPMRLSLTISYHYFFSAVNGVWPLIRKWWDFIDGVERIIRSITRCLNMATKLTKAFAEFVGGRGFLIANEGEISQQPGEDYKLARQIFRNRTVLVKFMADLAVAVTTGDRLHKYHVEKESAVQCLRNFLTGLEKSGYVLRWSNVGTLFSVQVPDDRKRLVFFRSGWAEQCFRSAICTTVSEFCKAHKPCLSFKMSQNVKLTRKGESTLFTELDLVVQIERRFYLFEIKSGPWVRILQWARRRGSLLIRRTARCMRWSADQRRCCAGGTA